MTPPLPSGTVTMLFTDIEGSTRLLHQLGDEYGAMLADHRRVLRAVWDRYEGIEVGTEGDSFFVAFADAESAVEAAIAAQRALAAHPWPSDAGAGGVRVRIGLHTGEPRIDQGDYWGVDVHYASRIGAAANGGQILASHATRALDARHEFESLGEHSLKDFIAPRELFHLVVDGAGAADFPPPRTMDRIRTNLPAPTTELIGREDELAVLLDLIGTARMVTVSGPGGSGKTRLALEVAQRAAEGFDAVWWVALEHILDPNEVLGALSRTMGLPEVAGVEADERVLDHLRARNVLLVLDNLEHLIEVAPLIGQVARAGPRSGCWSVSQLPLRVAGEHVLALDPLAVPTGSERELSALREVASVALLCERAAATGTGWMLSEENRFDVVRLCRQLEGMPLALELAAPRLRVLDAGALSSRLEESLDALGSGGPDLPAPPARPARRAGVVRGPAVRGRAIAAARARGVLGGVHHGAGARLPSATWSTSSTRCSPRGWSGRGTAGGSRCARRCGGSPPSCSMPRTRTPRTRRSPMPSSPWPSPSRSAGWCTRSEGRLALNPRSGNIFAELDWAQLMDYGRHARLAAATGWWMNYSSAVEFSRDHLEIALARSTDAVMRARCLQALGALGLKDSDPTGSLDAADAWHDLDDVEGEFYSTIYAANLYGHAREPEAQIELVERAAELAGRIARRPRRRVDPRRRPCRGGVAGGSSRGGHRTAAAAVCGCAQWILEAVLARDAPSRPRARSPPSRGRAGPLRGGPGRLAPLRSPVGELIQATTIAVALLHLGRVAEAAAVWAVCELGYDELSWPPHGAVRRVVRSGAGQPR